MKWNFFWFGLSLIVFACADARADNEDSLRISRPTFRMPQELRFSDGRMTLIANHFALWTRNYCRPVICSSVLCGGSCAAFLDSCPSFTGLAVLAFWQSASSELLVESGKSCPVNVPRGLVVSDGCRFDSNSCENLDESSINSSCCNP